MPNLPSSQPMGEYVAGPDVNDPEAFTARIDGDSMAPLYRPGDIVVLTPARSPQDGDDCFVQFSDGQSTFKRVFYEKGGSMLRLQPLCDARKPRTVPSSAVVGIYLAAYVYRPVNVHDAFF